MRKRTGGIRMAPRPDVLMDRFGKLYLTTSHQRSDVFWISLNKSHSFTSRLRIEELVVSLIRPERPLGVFGEGCNPGVPFGEGLSKKIIYQKLVPNITTFKSALRGQRKSCLLRQVTS